MSLLLLWLSALRVLLALVVRLAVLVLVLVLVLVAGVPQFYCTPVLWQPASSDVAEATVVRTQLRTLSWFTSTQRASHLWTTRHNKKQVMVP